MTCLEHLQNLIRINTTNPPGNELAAVLYLKSVLDAAQIDYKIFEPKPGRASIIARLHGDGTAKPFLMSSHLDVVPADAKAWSVDPFAGIIQDDCIWGRGAVDMKNMTAMTLSVLLKLKADNVPLKRDVIFAAVADEEAGSVHGSKWLVDNHPELLRAEYGVNEVGGFSLNLGGQTFYPIGVAEKGVVWFEIVAKGESGHGSLPHQKQVLQKIGKALVTLTQNKMPFQASPVVCDFIDSLSAGLTFPKNLLVRGLKNKFLNPLLLKLQADQHSALKLRAMFQNTIAPTLLSASDKINVIAGSAKIGIDGRILPGSSIEEFFANLKKILKPSLGEDYEIQILHAQNPSIIPDYRNAFFTSLCDTLQKLDPGSHPIPFLVPGFSDSHHYHRLDIKCYGFAPAKLPAHMNLADLYHAHNERLPLAALEFGLRALWDVVHQWCVA